MINEIRSKERGTNVIGTNECNESGQCALREGAGDADGDRRGRDKGKWDKGKWELL